MLAKVYSSSVFGVDAYQVEVEVDLGGGMPHYTMAGLPDSAVWRSRAIEDGEASIKRCLLSQFFEICPGWSWGAGSRGEFG